MTRVPEVSVIIPTRDRWALLSRHALPSALGQEDVELEVIVVDDGSSDGTAERLAALKDRRIRVIRIDPAERQPRSRTTAHARNVGIAAARAPWLAFLDDDDLWSPRKLRLQLDAAAREGAAFVYAAVVTVDETLKVLGVQEFPDPDRLAELLVRGNYVPGGGSNAIAEADLVRRVGGFDEELVFVEDWDLWIRLARAGRVAACSEVLVARVEHAGGALFRERPDVVEDVHRLLSKYTDVGERRALATTEWLAWEHFRAGRRLAAARLYARAAIRFRSAGNIPPALGALFGRPGMRAARSLIEATRGSAHFGAESATVPAPPQWLDRYRARDGDVVKTSRLRRRSVERRRR